VQQKKYHQKKESQKKSHQKKESQKKYHKRIGRIGGNTKEVSPATKLRKQTRTKEVPPETI
jgi:hypothetical protein